MGKFSCLTNVADLFFAREQKVRRGPNRTIPKLSVTERAVYGASMSLIPASAEFSKFVGSLTLRRPEGRAPTSRQLADALAEPAQGLSFYKREALEFML